MFAFFPTTYLWVIWLKSKMAPRSGLGILFLLSLASVHVSTFVAVWASTQLHGSDVCSGRRPCWLRLGLRLPAAWWLSIGNQLVISRCWFGVFCIVLFSFSGLAR